MARKIPASVNSGGIFPILLLLLLLRPKSESVTESFGHIERLEERIALTVAESEPNDVLLSEPLGSSVVSHPLLAEYDGRTYLRTNQSLNLADARTLATELGGQLVDINGATIGRWFDSSTSNSTRRAAVIEIVTPGTAADGDGLNDANDPSPTDAFNGFDLREAGVDGLFDTADDQVQLLSVGRDGLDLNFSVLDGPLLPGSYRLDGHTDLDRCGREPAGRECGWHRWRRFRANLLGRCWRRIYAGRLGQPWLRYSSRANTCRGWRRHGAMADRVVRTRVNRSQHRRRLLQVQRLSGWEAISSGVSTVLTLTSTTPILKPMRLSTPSRRYFSSSGEYPNV